MLLGFCILFFLLVRYLVIIKSPCSALAAENDESIGKGSGWERFDFDKDAPLDDEEIEG